MTLTKERKRQLVLLGILAVVGGYALISSLSSSSDDTPSRPAATTTRATPPPSTQSSAATEPAPRRAGTTGRASEDFRPSLKPKKPEDRVDPMTIDPTLRLDLLAKVQGVEMQGGSRNLFQASAAPPVALPTEPKIAVARKPAGPEPPPPPPGPPVQPPAPPITLKYYGYSSARGDNKKHAFFLDGEDILVGAEGDLVKKRYRVVKIGVNSVTMEDTQFKHEQTLQLQEEAAAG